MFLVVENTPRPHTGLGAEYCVKLRRQVGYLQDFWADGRMLKPYFDFFTPATRCQYIDNCAKGAGDAMMDYAYIWKLTDERDRNPGVIERRTKQ